MDFLGQNGPSRGPKCLILVFFERRTLRHPSKSDLEQKMFSKNHVFWVIFDRLFGPKQDVFFFQPRFLRDPSESDLERKIFFRENRVFLSHFWPRLWTFWVKTDPSVGPKCLTLVFFREPSKSDLEQNLFSRKSRFLSHFFDPNCGLFGPKRARLGAQNA